jgi:hypothetical protein
MELLMSDKSPNSSEEEYFYLNIESYLGLSLSKDEAQKFQKIVADNNFEEKISAYKHAKFKLEEKIFNYSLSSSDTKELKTKVVPQEVVESLEDENLRQIEDKERSSKFVKNILLALFFLFLGYGALSLMSPKVKSNFKPLESLVYETLVMASSNSKDHLDFPTNKLSEINSLFADNSKLSFKPVVFKNNPGTNWSVVGGSIIDYDTDKIVMLEFNKKDSTNDKAFLYSFKGDLSDFLQTTKNKLEGFDYQFYSSDDVSLIAWGHDGVVAFLVGWESSEDLLKMVKSGLGIKM